MSRLECAAERSMGGVGWEPPTEPRAEPGELVTVQFTRHLQEHDTALRVPRTGAVAWDDEAVHDAAHRADPEGYALCALVPGVLPAQRARVLLRLLLASRAL